VLAFPRPVLTTMWNDFFSTLAPGLGAHFLQLWWGQGMALSFVLGSGSGRELATPAPGERSEPKFISRTLWNIQK
jgi:uncharacterized membrane protein